MPISLKHMIVQECKSVFQIPQRLLPILQLYWNLVKKNYYMRHLKIQRLLLQRKNCAKKVVEKNKKICKNKEKKAVRISNCAKKSNIRLTDE